MQEIEKMKQELIKNGSFERYTQLKKDQYKDGYYPSDDPKYYGFDDEEMKLILALEKSTKKKKANFREHAQFMAQYYDNIGLLTLGYSDRTRDVSSLETKRHTIADILKQCFEDYIGKFEVSPNGKLHVHLIVGWNGEIETFPSIFKKGELTITKTMVKMKKLQDLWYGETTENGQPSKYGIYDLVLANKNRKDTNMSANYTLKGLNTMESYITKCDPWDTEAVPIDEDLLLAVNHANIITARNTPYQKWKKARAEQDRMIRNKVRAFDGTFFDQHKFDSKRPFREWAEKHKNDNISLIGNAPKTPFGEDFRLVDIKDF